MLEVYGNSGQFQTTIEEFRKEFHTPFDMFESLLNIMINRNCQS